MLSSDDIRLLLDAVDGQIADLEYSVGLHRLEELRPRLVLLKPARDRLLAAYKASSERERANVEPWIKAALAGKNAQKVAEEIAASVAVIEKRLLVAGFCDTEIERALAVLRGAVNPGDGHGA